MVITLNFQKCWEGLSIRRRGLSNQNTEILAGKNGKVAFGRVVIQPLWPKEGGLALGLGLKKLSEKPVRQEKVWER